MFLLLSKTTFCTPNGGGVKPASWPSVSFWMGQNPSCSLTRVQTAMPVLVRTLKDNHTLVKDTAAWTLGRICELHAQRIPQGYLQPLVESLGGALQIVLESHLNLALHYTILHKPLSVRPEVVKRMLCHLFRPLLTQLLADLKGVTGKIIIFAAKLMKLSTC